MGLKDKVARVKQQGAGGSSADRAIERASMAAGPDPDAEAMLTAQAESISRMLLRGDSGIRFAIANEMAQSVNDPASQARYKMALEMAESKSPGITSELLEEVAGIMRDGPSPAAEPAAEAVAEPAQDAAPKPKRGFAVGGKSEIAKNFPMHEQWKAYGQGTDSDDPVTGKRIRAQGLQQIVENMNEHRSRDQRAAEGNQLMAQYTASPKAYRAIRDLQVQRLSSVPLPPEVVATFSPKLVSQLTGVPLESVTDSVRESLIGKMLTPEQAINFLDRQQRASIAGPASFDQATMSEADMAAISDFLAGIESTASDKEISAEDRNNNFSVQDKLLGAIRRDAEIMGKGDAGAIRRPGELMLDQSMLRAFRYPFWQSQGGVLTQPPLAPSGDFAAALLQTLLDPKREDGSFRAMAAPVLDDAIRRAAPLSPVNEIYHGKKGRTAMDFARMKLPPFRDGAPLIKAEREGLWRYPQFMEGVWMNRGEPKPQLNLGNILLDPQGSALPAEPTISTPEGDVAPPPAGPPMMPSEGDTSMYDPRRMDIAALAALLA